MSLHQMGTISAMPAGHQVFPIPADPSSGRYYPWPLVVIVGYPLAILLDVALFPVAVALSIACLYFLCGKGAQSERLPTLTRRALIGFVALMGTLSLTAIIIDVVHFAKYNRHWDRAAPHIVISPILCLCLWGAEGFMLWRLNAHVAGRTTTSPVVAFVMGSATTILATLCIGTFVPLLLLEAWDTTALILRYRIATIHAAVVLLLITIIITYRRIYNDHAFGAIEKSWSAWGRLAARLFIESGALLSIAVFVAAVSFDPRGWLVFPIVILPQICVISPLLIVYCLARGSNEGVIRLSDAVEGPADVEHGETATEDAPMPHVVHPISDGKATAQ